MRIVMEDMRNETALQKSKEIALRLISMGKLSHEEIAEASGFQVYTGEKVRYNKPVFQGGSFLGRSIKTRGQCALLAPRETLKCEKHKDQEDCSPPITQKRRMTRSGKSRDAVCE